MYITRLLGHLEPQIYTLISLSQQGGGGREPQGNAIYFYKFFAFTEIIILFIIFMEH